ncbi:signal peptide peptidase SppA [Robiginitalea aurantiaca]|uniref:Signal peptide peptidase SppA n=1 Tax=Robiginitalea aurantiaca TaxID=3056915 RepID=A0ABT7WC56_9FLAO|nr:signal peptide peptidase SppA [Robiginitalea aurantiaca]MDM9630496.1 signal peptide peptidase SppA [Robiginitalea aurantiaca]
MAFLRNLLASILGTLFALGILFFMFLIFASLASVGDEVRVKPNSVLKLEFPLPVSEHSTTDPDDPFTIFFEPKMGLDQIVQAIGVAGKDDRIKGISISSPYLMSGMAQAKAIRDALEDFKAKGKFVYAYGDFYTQKDYYLSSVADSLFINPAGNLDFKGLAAEVLFFKDFQEKSGVKMEVVRHGKYKSAVEPFLSDKMSPENREQLSSLIQSLWESMRDGIGESRNIPAATLDQLADSLGGRNPEMALNARLVDALVYADTYEDKLLRESGGKGKHPEFITLQRYMRYSRKRPIYKGSDEIAVIYAQGEILYGEGSPEFIGQGKMTKALRKAREDKDVKAVVVRINSPGGSALSSELIWRELQLTRKAKPVVVSLSDIAASGGYYMAVGGDIILAEPNTITGSIGVFTTVPNLSGISEKVGINAEQVGTHHYSMDYSLFEPMREDFREVLRDGIEDTYQMFLERVSEGRKISLAKADSLAQGRVWSGKQALENGMVDDLGGMPEALELAAEMAGITDFKLQILPRYKTGLERLMEDLGGGQVSADQVITSELGPEWGETIMALKQLLKQEGIQARMPFILKIN